MDETPATTPEPTLPDSQTTPPPAVENGAQTPPAEVQAEASLPTPQRPPAADLLTFLLEQNNLEISLPPVTTRSINDGSLIVDLPKSITVKYRDE